MAFCRLTTSDRGIDSRLDENEKGRRIQMYIGVGALIIIIILLLILL
jgi:hypothetical protein